VDLPIVLGHEPVGVIEELGEGVTQFRVGDRVGVSWVQGTCGRCPYCLKHDFFFCPEQITWSKNGGGHSELMVAEAWGCTLLPDAISWVDAAPIFCAGFTAFSGYRRADPQPGERVGVIGIGGLGHLAVQYAKAMGHEVVAITGSADKKSLAQELGADEVLVVKEHAGQELQAMGGVDVLLSTSNSMSQNSQAFAGLRPHGRLVTMALGAGAIEVDPMICLFNQTALLGSSQNKRSDLIEALDLVAAGKVKPKLEVYSLDEVNTGLTRLAEGKVRFRAVVSYGD